MLLVLGFFFVFDIVGNLDSQDCSVLEYMLSFCPCKTFCILKTQQSAISAAPIPFPLTLTGVMNEPGLRGQRAG